MISTRIESRPEVNLRLLRKFQPFAFFRSFMITIALSHRDASDETVLFGGRGGGSDRRSRDVSKLILSQTARRARTSYVRRTFPRTSITARRIRRRGQDVLDDHGGAGLYQRWISDRALQNDCAVARVDYQQRPPGALLKVATSCAHGPLALRRQGVPSIHKLYGSMELAPSSGLLTQSSSWSATSPVESEGRLRLKRSLRSLAAIVTMSRSR